MAKKRVSCEKCGNKKVRAIYEPPIANDPCWYERQKKNFPKGEFILRICEFCGFEWAQDCLSRRRKEGIGR